MMNEESCTVCLRLKLVRGGAGVVLDADGRVSELTDRAENDGLKLGDHIWDPAQLTCARCEISILRRDHELARTLREHGKAEHALPCFRLLKLLTKVQDGLGVHWSGSRVQKVDADGPANGIVSVDDIIVSLDGTDITEVGIDDILRQPSSAPFRVLTVLRRCPEHDLPVSGTAQDEDASPACAAAESTNKSPLVVATIMPQTDEPPALISEQSSSSNGDAAPVTENRPSSLSDQCSSSSDTADAAASVSQSTSQDQTTELNQPNPAALPECRSSCDSPAAAASVNEAIQGYRDSPTRRPSAKAASDGDSLPFDPLDATTGEWCDITPLQRKAMQHLVPCYNQLTGNWSDLPSQTQDEELSSRRAILDLMIQQALKCHDNELLRRLVAAQQALPVANAGGCSAYR